jgi:SdpC family antimicrobial peptide
MKLKTVRKICSRIEVAILLSTVILYSGCTKVNTKPTSSTEQKIVKNLAESSSSLSARNSDFSDLQVFKGVMFLDGPIALNYLGDFNNFAVNQLATDDQLIADIRITQDSIINRLISSDTTYLEKFRAEISSGDYQIVENAVRKAGQDILTELVALTNDNTDLNSIYEHINSFIHSNNLSSTSSMADFKSAIDNEVSGAKPTIDFKLKVKVMGYAYYVVFGVVLIIVVIVAATDTQQQSSFYNEEFVATVTTNLNSI